MKLKKKCQNAMISFLERRYPGVREVVDLLDKIRERVEHQYVEGVTEVDAKKSLNSQAKTMFYSNDDDQLHSDIFKPDDKKWRPVILTLGLMYKLQKVTDDKWYDDTSVFVQDDGKKVQIVELLARYWWYIMDLAKTMRGDIKELTENIAKGIGVVPECVQFAFTKDADKAVVEEHCPDIALVVHNDTKEIVLTVCGTKMFPVPSVADILMDLYCENVPFHEGRAHKGMALACHNIITKTLDILVTLLNKYPDHRLVILGYSLGAGVAQLLAIELTKGNTAAMLPQGAQVLCVTFGAPPVYLHSSPGFTLSNLVSVYNHNDGLASLSLHTVTKLFLQIRAVNRLGLGRCRILKLLRKKIGRSQSMYTTQDSINPSIRVHVMSDQDVEREWGDILSAVNVVKETGFYPLNHIAGLTYLVKRVDNSGQAGQDHVVRMLKGCQAAPLAGELRLRGGMFNDHMPWGYASLFKDCGEHSLDLSLDTITSFITYL